jgi:hypothetical protein
MTLNYTVPIASMLSVAFFIVVLTIVMLNAVMLGVVMVRDVALRLTVLECSSLQSLSNTWSGAIDGIPLSNIRQA